MKSRMKNYKKSFFSIVILGIGFTFLLFALLEYQMVHSIFLAYNLEKEQEKKFEKESLLEELLHFEKSEIESFLRKYPDKTINDFVTKTEEGQLIMRSPKNTKSQGGYIIEQELPKETKKDFYRIYYIKNYQISEFHHNYKIRILVEYYYKNSKIIEDFTAEKLVEMRIFLE